METPIVPVWVQMENKRIDDVIKKLKKEGHTCMRLLETWPHQLVWCEQKDGCENKKQCRYNRIVRELEQKGHTCIMEVDSEEPIGIYWCQNLNKCNQK